jgi:hypothetical protein
MPRSPLRVLRASLFAAVCVTLALAGHAQMAGGAVPGWAPVAAFLLLAGVAWSAAGRERGLLAIGGGLIGAQTALHAVFTWTAAQQAPEAGLSRAQIEAQWLRVLLCNPDAAVAGGQRRSAADLLAGMGLDPSLALHPPSHLMAVSGQGGGHGLHAADSADAAGSAVPMGHGIDFTQAVVSSFVPSHGGAGMLLAHLAAGLGSAVWLWRGEKALFGLLWLLGCRAASAAALIRAWLRWGELPFPRLVTVRPRPSRVVSLWACRPQSRRGPPLTVTA